MRACRATHYVTASTSYHSRRSMPMCGMGNAIRARIMPTRKRYAIGDTRAAAAAAAPTDPVGGAVTDASTGSVRFTCVAKCDFGTSVVVTGSMDALGNWDPMRGLQLEWSEGHAWSADACLPIGEELRVKFVKIVSATSDVLEWQDGDDIVLTVEGGASIEAGSTANEGEEMGFGTCYSIAVTTPSAPAEAPAEEEILVDDDDDDAYEEATEPIASNGNGASAPVASVPESEAAAEDLVEEVASNDAAFSLPDGVEAAEEDTQGDDAVKSVSSSAKVRAISTKAEKPEKKRKPYFSVIKAIMKFF